MGTNKLSQSLEDYLEAIYEIVRRKKAARAKDISERLRVSRSSVTGALHTLSHRNLINYTPYDIVTLTLLGEQVAAAISNRHAALRDFLVDVLGVERGSAEQSACGMEHSVSEEILDRLTRFVECVRTCPGVKLRWDSTIGDFCDSSRCLEDCARLREDQRAQESDGGSVDGGASRE